MIQFFTILMGCVLVDTAQAETLSQGQDALRRSQLQFYQAAKSRPKATREELARLRDTTQAPGAAAWARGVNGSIAQALGKGRSTTPPGAAASTKAGGTMPKSSVSPAPKRFNSTSDQPGINGAEVPGMLEFPGSPKK